MDKRNGNTENKNVSSEMHGEWGEGKNGGQNELQAAEKTEADVKRVAEKAKGIKGTAVRKAMAAREEKEEDIESLGMSKEVKKTPGPAVAATAALAGSKKTGEENQKDIDGGEKKVFSMKEHRRNKDKMREEAEEKNAETEREPNGSKQRADGVNTEMGSGDEEKDGKRRQNSGKREGKGKADGGINGERNKEKKGEEKNEREERTGEGGNEKDDDNVEYLAERTLKVTVEGGVTKLTMLDLLVGIQEMCGRVLGCRAKGERVFEVTMHTWEGKEMLLEGLRVKGVMVEARELGRKDAIVSFMHMPMYLRDDVILMKLLQWGVKPVSKIIRRMVPGTKVADGTRYLRVEFGAEVKSLPYSTKFEGVEGVEYVNVRHDGQSQVCRYCLRPGHIFRECPAIKCHRCNGAGHLARNCGMGERRREEGGQGPQKGEDGGGDEFFPPPMGPTSQPPPNQEDGGGGSGPEGVGKKDEGRMDGGEDVGGEGEAGEKRQREEGSDGDGDDDDGDGDVDDGGGDDDEVSMHENDGETNVGGKGCERAKLEDVRKVKKRMKGNEEEEERGEGENEVEMEEEERGSEGSKYTGDEEELEQRQREEELLKVKMMKKEREEEKARERERERERRRKRGREREREMRGMKE